MYVENVRQLSRCGSTDVSDGELGGCSDTTSPLTGGIRAGWAEKSLKVTSEPLIFLLEAHSEAEMN